VTPDVLMRGKTFKETNQHNKNIQMHSACPECAKVVETELNLIRIESKISDFKHVLAR
jgi:hypothetical protein